MKTFGNGYNDTTTDCLLRNTEQSLIGDDYVADDDHNNVAYDDDYGGDDGGDGDGDDGGDGGGDESKSGAVLGDKVKIIFAIFNLYHSVFFHTKYRMHTFECR